MCALKIIAGEAKGRNIKTLTNTDLSVRPILGRIKKSLFDILRPKIVGSKFLDLYAGTGSVGLEALSRGATKVIFVELEEKSLELIKYNLKFLGWEDRAEILNFDITKGLENIRSKFDLIFMGPPYKDENKKPLAFSSITLENIMKADLLSDNGCIIGQHHDKEPVKVCEGLIEFRREKYGDSVLSFFRKAG